MRIRVSDASATDDLLEHLALQGFPSTYVDRDELSVLFPGSPTLFASAAELDLWAVEHGDVTLTYDTASGREPHTFIAEALAGGELRRRGRHALSPSLAHARAAPR